MSSLKQRLLVLKSYRTMGEDFQKKLRSKLGSSLVIKAPVNLSESIVVLTLTREDGMTMPMQT